MVECQASTLQSVICGHPIYKQIWRLLVGKILTLEWEKGNNHDKFAVSLLKHATVLGHVPREFRGCFGTSSGTERPSLVKLSIEESLFPALVKFSSFFVLLDTFCLKFVY